MLPLHRKVILHYMFRIMTDSWLLISPTPTIFIAAMATQASKTDEFSHNDVKSSLCEILQKNGIFLLCVLRHDLMHMN